MCFNCIVILKESSDRCSLYKLRLTHVCRPKCIWGAAEHRLVGRRRSSASPVTHSLHVTLQCLMERVERHKRTL